MHVQFLSVLLLAFCFSNNLQAVKSTRVAEHLRRAEATRVIIDRYRELKTEYDKSQIYLNYFKTHIQVVEENSASFWEQLDTIRAKLNDYPDIDALRVEKNELFALLNRIEDLVRKVRAQKYNLLAEAEVLADREREIMTSFATEGLNAKTIEKYAEFVLLVTETESAAKDSMFILGGAHQVLPRMQRNFLVRLHRLNALVQVEMQKFCLLVEDAMRPECMLAIPEIPKGVQ